jgi:hypothetical protein
VIQALVREQISRQLAASTPSDAAPPSPSKLPRAEQKRLQAAAVEAQMLSSLADLVVQKANADVAASSRAHSVGGQPGSAHRPIGALDMARAHKDYLARLAGGAPVGRGDQRPASAPDEPAGPPHDLPQAAPVELDPFALALAPPDGSPRDGVVLATTAVFVFVRPCDGGYTVVCPIWTADDWSAMQPGVEVLFEIDQDAEPYYLGAEAPGGVSAKVGDTVQAGTSVWLASSGSEPLIDLLEQVDEFLQTDERRARQRQRIRDGHAATSDEAHRDPTWAPDESMPRAPSASTDTVEADTMRNREPVSVGQPPARTDSSRSRAMLRL